MPEPQNPSTLLRGFLHQWSPHPHGHKLSWLLAALLLTNIYTCSSLIRSTPSLKSFHNPPAALRQSLSMVFKEYELPELASIRLLTISQMYMTSLSLIHSICRLLQLKCPPFSAGILCVPYETQYHLNLPYCVFRQSRIINVLSTWVYLALSAVPRHNGLSTNSI